jgi:hypothetical protein
MVAASQETLMNPGEEAQGNSGPSLRNTLLAIIRSLGGEVKPKAAPVVTNIQAEGTDSRQRGVEQNNKKRQELDSYKVMRLYYKYLSAVKLQNPDAQSYARECKYSIELELRTIALYREFFSLMYILGQYIFESQDLAANYKDLVTMMIKVCEEGISREKRTIPSSAQKIETYQQRVVFLHKVMDLIPQ